MKGQSWKCSTKWSSAKITEFCPKNTLVIANTLFPTTHKVTLNMDITRWFTRNQIDYILRSQRWKTSIQSAKIRPAADYDSDHELLIAKFRHKLRKVGKITRPFRYDLNQIPCDYTEELTNRFKGLDLLEWLKNCGWRFITLYRMWWTKPSPQKERNAR